MATIPIPTIDISAFTGEDLGGRERTAGELVTACHRHGYVAITGHGIENAELHAAFSVSKNLFALSHEDKMKAPHPNSATPHRGYSGPGVEKVIAAADLQSQGDERLTGPSLRRIEDYKESYEIGSEANKTHYNIWLPEDVLPGFRQFTTDLYWQLNTLGRQILDAFATGLKLTAEERQYLMTIHSGNNNQLRLLHYPAVSAEMLKKQVVARMPAHTDWSFFTMLFQDDVGGLEIQDPQQKNAFVAAIPAPGTLVLNIGDMLMRLTNGYLPSALHRVTVPAVATQTDPTAGQPMTPERYSIPYFVSPDDDATIKTFATCIAASEKSVYKTLKFSEYEGFRSQHSYVDSK